MIKLRPIKQNEKIAVTISTKNRHSYLTALLASIIHQTYANWMLVINDSSQPPAQENDALKDLFTLIKNKGHEIRIIHTESGWDRHQRAMEAVPESIEFIIRIDDDLVMTPTFLEEILKPFYFFSNRFLAAVGGCYPEPYMQRMYLDTRLTDHLWIPKVEEPIWRLQGHYYNERQIVEAESLLGHAICYQRSAVKDVGGWAVRGYSSQAYREESDLCARLAIEGYALMVTTDALAWHLISPSGGSRLIKKTQKGNFLISDIPSTKADDRLFQERISRLINKKSFTHKKLRRYEIRDLERNIFKSRPLATIKGKILIAIVNTFLRPIRDVLWYLRK